MTDKQQMVAAFIAALISQTGSIDASKQELTDAEKLADKILKGEKKNGKNDDDDGDDADEDSEGADSDDDDSEAGEEADDSDSDEAEDDEGNDDSDDESEEDGDSDEEDEDEEPKPKKKASKKSAPSTAGKKVGKAKKPEAKTAGKKKFKPKPQNYARDNDTHKEIFSGVLKAVAPNWKKDAASKKRAKDVSVKLEGEKFLDVDGNVLVTFKQSVKKAMIVKK